MVYRRRSGLYSSYGGNNSSYSNLTRVTIHWSQKSGAYAIKFANTRHWDEMKIFLDFIKQQPYGERDYDPDNKVWYLHEKHINGFREMLKLMAQYFEEDFQEKPVGDTRQHTFVPIEIYLDKFKDLTTIDLRTIADYNDAKKLYRRSALNNHPDRGGDSQIMSSINECWSVIEKEYYKQKKELEYVSG